MLCISSTLQHRNLSYPESITCRHLPKAEEVIIQVIFAAVVLIIIIQLANLQILSTKYKLAAESNALYRKVIYPDRGIIFDRNRKPILENVIIYDLVVIPVDSKGTDTAGLCSLLKN
jgi:penicillin-binding protein 2